MQTATNPKTGEIAVLVDNKWVKADRVASNDKGEKAYLVGGKWLTDAGKIDLPSPDGKPVSAGGVTAEIGKGLVRGASNVAKMIPEAIATAAGPVRALVKQGVEALSSPSRDVVQAKPENEAER